MVDWFGCWVVGWLGLVLGVLGDSLVLDVGDVAGVGVGNVVGHDLQNKGNGVRPGSQIRHFEKLKT